MKIRGKSWRCRVSGSLPRLLRLRYCSQRDIICCFGKTAYIHRAIYFKARYAGFVHCSCIIGGHRGVCSLTPNPLICGREIELFVWQTDRKSGCLFRNWCKGFFFSPQFLFFFPHLPPPPPPPPHHFFILFLRKISCGYGKSLTLSWYLYPLFPIEPSVCDYI